MSRHQFKLSFLILGIAAVSLFAQVRPKPNIVLIVSDDHGWQDIKAMDAGIAGNQSWAGTKSWQTPYETPFMDQLISGGMMFVQGYSSTPVCSPSRGSFLTGKAPASVGRVNVRGGTPPNIRGNLVTPFYLGRMPESEITIAEALNAHGYLSGHVGKWHCALHHTTFPNAQDQGFHEYVYHGRGVTTKPFKWATSDDGDSYRVKDYTAMYTRNQATGYGHPTTFPTDSVTEHAVAFIDTAVAKQKPFFLYLATWLVHTPINTRNKPLHDYYANKMKTADAPTMKNVKYASMVTTLDWTVGNVLDVLRNTDDPRWPGHKLIDNTYIIFTADNGGLEPYTDNFPLDKGKHRIQEGGIHVPFMVMGPNIAAGVINHNMVIQTDLYPTIMALTNIPVPAAQRIEGVSLKPLLFNETSGPLKYDNHPYFKDQAYNTLVWHFPNRSESVIRKESWKLIKNYNNKTVFKGSSSPPFRLYKLYKDDNKTPEDLSEKHDVAAANPEKVAELDSILRGYLATFDYGEANYYNPSSSGFTAPLSSLRSQVPTITAPALSGDTVQVGFTLKGQPLSRAWLLYTKGGVKYPGSNNTEWFRIRATIDNNAKKVWAILPKRTITYQFHLIDTNNFIVASSKKDVPNPMAPCPAPAGYVGEDGTAPITMGDDCYEGVVIVSAKSAPAVSQAARGIQLSITARGVTFGGLGKGIASVEILNLRGDRIAAVPVHGSGAHWDRTAANGSYLSTGIYIARVKGKGVVQSARFLLCR